MLVFDINAVVQGVNPECFAVVGDIAYFVGTDAAHGRELWRTDGTQAGTKLVADIEPGRIGSNPNELTVVGSKVFFSAEAGSDRELWVTDGTAGGTKLVKNINFGGWSAPSELAPLGDSVLFSADDDIHGQELWVSDGTEAGTRMVKDLEAGRFGSGRPMELTPFQGKVFFTASQIEGAFSVRLLWSTDGTEAGTVVVSSIDPTERGDPGSLVVSGGKLFFAGSSTVGTRELWVSDGTEAGTVPVYAFETGRSAIYATAPFGSGVLFAPSHGGNGHELWFSDGTQAGTFRLADISTSAAPSSYPSKAVVVGGTAYFAADDGVHGRELWATDGTPAGTRLVLDANPGTAGSNPSALIALGDTLSYAADDGIHGNEPWLSDGTQAGTKLITDVNPAGNGVTGSASFGAVARLNGWLLFGADDGDGTQLWRSDGTTAGTNRVATIDTDTATGDAIAGDDPFAPKIPTAVLDGFVYFPADDGVHGTELWKSDGTAGGTSLVADLTEGGEGSRIETMTQVGDRVFVTVGGGYDQFEKPIPAKLFVTQGTQESTVSLAEGDFGRVVTVGGVVFAQTNDGNIVRTDGTPAGTSVIDDAHQSEYGLDRGFLGVGDRLFYEKVVMVATETGFSEEYSIWTADEAGNVAEFVAAQDYGAAQYKWEWGVPYSASNAAPDGFLLWGSMGDSNSGYNTIWKLDFTGAFTQFTELDATVRFDSYNSVVVDGTVYFVAKNVDTLELRASDGTPKGTRIVAAIATQTDESSPFVFGMRPFGQGIAFARRVSLAEGPSLWISDGTTAGTRELVASIESIEGMVDGRIAYRKRWDDGVVRLYLTDGTAGGTTTVPDASGRSDVDPMLFGAVGDRLLFAATDVPHGRELFSVSLTAATTPGKPTAVSVLAASGQATVSWMAPASDGGAAVSDYRLEQSSDGGTTWQAVADGVSTATTAAVTSLVNGTSYRFRVAAVNSVGTGSWSDPSAAVTPTGVPGAAMGVVATAGDGRVSLSWSAPSSDGGRPITDYVVEQSSDGGATWKIVAEKVSPATSTMVAGLVNGTSYVFRVSTVNTSGIAPASAASVAAIPAKPAGPPTLLKATRGDGQVTLSWRAPASNGGSAIAGYTVESSTDGGKTWKRQDDGISTGLTAIVKGLNNGTSYVYRVAAVNSVGAGTFTTATTPVIPASLAGVPVDVVAARGNKLVTLTWKTPASNGGLAITDYVIQSSTDGGATWKTAADKVSPATTATVTGLVNGVSYMFRVAAVTGVGTGAFGSPPATVVPATLAGVPTGLVATRGNTEVTLLWKAPAATGGVSITDYLVQQSKDGGKTWTTVADGLSTSLGTVVKGLNNGTSYVYRVAAVNSVGAGTFTTATTPVIPASLAGVPVDVVAARGNKLVTLTWKTPASNGGLAITDYVIQSSTDGGATWKTAADKVSPATTATVTGLVNGVSYMFRVAAVTGVGTGAFGSPPATVVPATLAGVPTGLVATRGNTEVTLLWKAPAATGGVSITDYLVQQSKDGGKTWTTVADGLSTSLGTVVKGLNNGTSYVYRVAAVNEMGTGPHTPKSVAVVPATYPVEPTQFAVNRSGSTATLSWRAPVSTGGVSITDYSVEWSADDGATWKKLVRTPSSSATAVVGGLSAKLTYRFRVAAKNAAGLSSAFVEAVSGGTA